MAQIERFVRETDVTPTCECASRKCGPHHCWPSRVGWTFLGVVFLYAITMHSFYQTSVVERMNTLEQTVMEQVKAQVQAQREEGIDAIVLSAQARLQPTMDYVRHIAALLQDAQRLSWVLTTPQVTREVEILQRLEVLEAHP